MERFCLINCAAERMMKMRIITYLVLVFGIPAMLIVANQFWNLSSTGSGWLADAIPLANLGIFIVLIFVSRFRHKTLHVLGGVAGTVALYMFWGIVYTLLNPETAFEGIH